LSDWSDARLSRPSWLGYIPKWYPPEDGHPSEYILMGPQRRVKLAFHGADTDTDSTRTSSPTSARGSSRGCLRVRRLPGSACHEPDTHDDPRRLVRHAARFSSPGSWRGCPLGMRACTRVLYTVYKISLNDRRIPNVVVRVGVGPVEFQLNYSCDTTSDATTMPSRHATFVGL